MNPGTVARLAIGGFVNHRKPLGLLRALASEWGDAFRPESLVILSASYDLDLALELWPSIVELHCPFIGIEGVTAASPGVKARLLAGTLEAPAWDTGLLCLAIAGESARTKAGIGTDLPALNPWLREVEGLIEVAPLPIDLAICEVPYADAQGNLGWRDSPWGDLLLLEKAQSSVVSVVERLEAFGEGMNYVMRRSERVLIG